MFSFGAGVLWCTPQQDALGATIAAPTPQMFGTMQNNEVDFKFELKELYGEKQFAVAVGRGKGSVSGKAGFADLRMGMLESLVFGQSSSSGLVAVNYDTVGTVAAATVTVVPPSAGTFDADLGVVRASDGRVFTRVSGAPAASGQYSVNAVTGAYGFHTSDVGTRFYINYRYTTANPASARKVAIQNLPMGYAPSFRADLYVAYSGKSYVLTLNRCISEGIKLGNKNDDFATPDLSWKCFADDAGVIGTLSLWE